MLKRILVPLDGSDHFPAVFAEAARIAKRTGAELQGLAIVDEPEIMKPEPAPAGTSGFLKEKRDQRMADSRQKVAELTREFLALAKKAGVKAATSEQEGDPAEVIEQQSHCYDLIVMGQKSSFKHITQDEPCKTTHEVIKASPRPLIVVPKDNPGGEGVHIAVDGSHPASRAYQMFHLMGLGTTGKTQVICLHEKKDKAERICSEAGAYLASHDIKATLDAVASDEHPWDYLNKRLSADQPEMMVMGAHGTSGLKEFFMGSVSKKLIETSPVPLFIYH